jgi:hypothetical protein
MVCDRIKIHRCTNTCVSALYLINTVPVQGFLYATVVSMLFKPHMFFLFSPVKGKKYSFLLRQKTSFISEA